MVTGELFINITYEMLVYIYENIISFGKKIMNLDLSLKSNQKEVYRNYYHKAM